MVVEHNLEVMKGADWVIDFGPGGGIHGGDISFEGTPEDLVKEKKNLTAKYLAPVLKDAPKVGFREFLGDSESAKL